MKNIIFEIRYYLLFLVLSVGFFLALIFGSESSTNSVNENFNSREIERSNIDLEKFLPLNSEKGQTSKRTQIIYVDPDNGLVVVARWIEKDKVSDFIKLILAAVSN